MPAFTSPDPLTRRSDPDALGLGDSGNYGHAHAAANAPVQAEQQVPVVRLGEAAAYPAALQGARVTRSQQAAQSPALAVAPALSGTAYLAN